MPSFSVTSLDSDQQTITTIESSRTTIKVYPSVINLGDGIGSELPTVILNSNTNLLNNQRYLLNSVSLLTLTLPIASITGDRILIYGVNAASWRMAQNAGQLVRVGDLTTTLGVTGAIVSGTTGQAITLTYFQGGVWFGSDILGNLEVI